LSSVDLFFLFLGGRFFKVFGSFGWAVSMMSPDSVDADRAPVRLRLWFGV
jgi:hypothetical protein